MSGGAGKRGNQPVGNGGGSGGSVEQFVFFGRPDEGGSRGGQQALKFKGEKAELLGFPGGLELGPGSQKSFLVGRGVGSLGSGNVDEGSRGGGQN